MTRVFAASFLMIVLLTLSYGSFAQEEDYSDYSYLWEDKKSKKKKKKKKAVVEESAFTVAADSIPADTSVVDSPGYPADSSDFDTSDLAKEEEWFEQKGESEAKASRKKAPPVEDFRAGLPSAQSNGSFNGGFTYTQIGGQNYVGLVLSPEFKLWKFGVGLNIPILYGLEDQSIRTEIFKDGVGAARLIRYIRYGTQKVDPVYVRVGELSGTMIGYGSLINNYTNTTSYEKRKMGIHYDFNVKGLAGVEGLYSDFDPASLNLLAVRPYIRPLAWSSVPVIRTFEIGAQVIRDKDQTERPTSDSTYTTYTFTKPGIGAIGIDAGITLLSVPFIQIDAFMGWSKLRAPGVLKDSLNALYLATGQPEAMDNGYQDGSGYSYGLNFRFHFIADLLSTDVRIERLNFTDHYLPQFFDATYELNKDAKLLLLGRAQAMSGTYGSLTGHILHKVMLGGSLMIPDEITEEAPAVVRVNADVERLADKVSMHASYIKGNLTDLKDAFTFDENSLAKVRFIYHLNSFLAAGVDYYWAFAPLEDGSYKATKYVSPYFGLAIQF